MTSNSDLNKEGFVTLNPAEELSLREEVKDAARKQCNNEIKGGPETRLMTLIQLIIN